ncbi:MAG: amidohydrolase family protein [Lachnospiraceae bacterium]|nr:amidohydrolase family protein [Lachnospiraceae bacterium]
MMIDIHTHTFPDKIADRAVDKLSHEAHVINHTNGTVDGLIASMEEADVDLSVVVPVATDPSQVIKINDRAINNNEKYYFNSTGRRVFSFGAIHPDFADYKAEILRIKESGMKGIKIHPVYQDTDINDIRYLNIIDFAAANDLIVLTHAGLDVGYPGAVRCSPKMCREVIDKIGDFKFILAHMGGWENWDEVPETFADTNAYIDTAFSTEDLEPLSDGYWDGKDISMLGRKDVKAFVKAFGSDRILFGSDSPWTKQSRSIEFLRECGLDKEDLDKILGGNAKKLLGI